MKNITLIMLGVITSYTAFAQNTLDLKEGATSPKATIEEVSWIAGIWRGEAMGGVTEEIWSEPLGGSMMGSFKLVMNNEVTFYELETISEENGSLMMKIKHFDAALTGWEEKDETVDFALVKLTENKAFFNGLTFELVNKDELNIYVVMKDDDHTSESKFNYKRFK